LRVRVAARQLVKLKRRRIEDANSLAQRFEDIDQSKKELCDDYRPTSHRIRGNCCTSHDNTRARHGTRHTELDSKRANLRCYNNCWNLLRSLFPPDTFSHRTT